MGCIDVCNEYIAVEECIELRSIDVKEKTTDEWKNRQQFFPAINQMQLQIGLSSLRTDVLLHRIR